ncbi:putative hemolysin [Gracilibacillus halotolerans]|uniref:Putative hemolysin n=1 Tax=Gracilibacillus halotolerans TaxID=74386 RepID=A0A841RMA6_9BACI|nr:hemolysin family protein [Gracilibacillus halotolerans]MBB6512753.1 putative hemolysin [Gracilibacillus halotolerans]
MEIMILIILILVNAFFAASEISLVALNDNKINKRAQENDKKSIKLKKLLDEPGRFLATIQIGITLAGFLASAFAADSFATPLANWLKEIGVPLSVSLLETISVIVITLLLSYFTLVVGELVPKQLALQKAEQIAYLTVNPLSILFKISFPFVKLLNISTNLIVKLFGVDPNAKKEEANEEEIRMLVDIGGEQGTIEVDEKQMIHNIFELNDKQVSDVMTHRTEIIAIQKNAPLDEILQIMNEKRFTRFPIYEENMDNIIGILHMKDMFPYLSQEKVEFSLEAILREPYYVMEMQPIDVAFNDMKANNAHIAIVLDEYGGVDGIVTMEDMIEEIVGEIMSEHHLPGEQEESEIIPLTDEQYRVEGVTNLYELEEVFQVELPTEEFETINGFFVHLLGRIPKIGEQPTVTYKNLKIEAEVITEHKVETFKITVLEKEKK